MKKKEIIIILIQLFLFLFFLTIDIFGLYIFRFTNISSIEDLFNTFFTVQGSITTVNIAVITLFAGIQKERIYGVSITQYVMQQKPYLFKYYRLIIASLIIIPINFWMLANKYYSTFSLLFLFSIELILIIVKDVFYVFCNFNKVIQDIFNYAIKNIDTKFLIDFQNDIIISIGTNNIAKLKDNYDLLLILFKNEITKDNKETIEKLEDVYIQTFNAVYQLNNSIINLQCLELLLKIYNHANKITYLRIFDNIEFIFYRMIKTINIDKLIETNIVIDLRNSFYNNINVKGDKRNNCENIQFFSVYLYDLMNANSSKIFKDKLYEDLNYNLKYVDLPIEKKKIMLEELTLYTKKLIDNYEIDILNKYVFPPHHITITYDSFLYYLKIYIYLYYLGYRETEKYIDDKSKKFAKEILKQHTSQITNFIYNNKSNLGKSSVFSDIKNNLITWEKIPYDEVKLSIIDFVVEDFLIMCYLEIYYDDELTSVLKQNFNQEVVALLYSRYFEDEKNKYVNSIVKSFNSMLLVDNYNDIDKIVDQKVETLKSALTKMYVENEVLKSRKLNLSEDSIKKYLEEINLILDKQLINTFSFFNCNISAKMNRLEIPLPPYFILVEFLGEKAFYENVEKHIRNGILYILNSIIIDHVKLNEVNEKQKDKLTDFFASVNDFSAGPIDTIITYKNTFINDSKNQLYQDFIINKKVINTFSKYIIALNSQLVNVNVIKTNIELLDLTELDMKNKTNRKNDDYYYNIVNSISLPFKIENLIEYIHNTRKKLSINVEIEYGFRDDTIGAGIEIKK